jgi:membrane fusion protein, heavy metal efflux system
MVDAQTRTVPAIFEFANPAGRLRAGTRVAAYLFTGRSAQGIAVPVSALVDEGPQTVLYVQSGGESFQRRVVVPGPRDGDWVAVPSGVAPGERVVTAGAYQVRLAAAAPAAAGHGHAH